MVSQLRRTVPLIWYVRLHGGTKARLFAHDRVRGTLLHDPSGKDPVSCHQSQSSQLILRYRVGSKPLAIDLNAEALVNSSGSEILKDDLHQAVHPLSRRSSRLSDGLKRPSNEHCASTSPTNACTLVHRRLATYASPAAVLQADESSWSRYAKRSPKGAFGNLLVRLAYRLRRLTDMRHWTRCAPAIPKRRSATDSEV